MADRPILFSAPMVRALLAGTKTQTRRLMETPRFRAFEHPVAGWRYEELRKIDGQTQVVGGGQFDIVTATPYLRISVGDRLYVRETWCPLTHAVWGACPIADATYSMTKDGAHQHKDGRYTPGLDRYAKSAFDHIKWRPGIHMPRWASRITLHVTDARVQRLHDISEEDAFAEGMTDATAEAIMSPDDLALYASTHILCPEARGRILYQHIWDQINGTREVPEPWALNPWVAAYTFEVERANIAQARAA